MNDTPTVIDGEVVPENPVMNAVPPATSDGATVSPAAFDINAYNATLEIVRRRLAIIEKAAEELKKYKEMHDDAFANDPTFAAADKIVKDATNKRKEIMAMLAKQPALAEVMGKVKDLKETIKSNQESLTQELMEYYRTAGVMEIEDADGNVQEFVFTIRLKPKVKVG